MNLADTIRAIPDYPKPGIIFRDITTLLGNARAFRRTVEAPSLRARRAAATTDVKTSGNPRIRVRASAFSA